MAIRTILLSIAVLGCSVKAASAFTHAPFTGCTLALNPTQVSTRSPSLRVGNRGYSSVSMAATKTMPETARSCGLALALDDGTRKSHSMAENTRFVTGFFKGISNRVAFAKLVASLYFVYEAMETAFDEASDPKVKAMDFQRLRRIPALERDMEFFYGPDWRQKVQPSPETQKYVARIREVATSQPQLLVAHQYTRYLGDLFGGQMMSGMAVRSLGLQGKDGVSFFHFNDIPNTKDFIEEWYTAVNELPLSEVEKQAVVDEANAVFAHNIGIFQELDSKSLGAYMAMLKLAYVGIAEKLWGRDAVVVV